MARLSTSRKEKQCGDEGNFISDFNCIFEQYFYFTHEILTAFKCTSQALAKTKLSNKTSTILPVTFSWIKNKLSGCKTLQHIKLITGSYIKQLPG